MIKNAVIWGAGKRGKKVYESLDYNIKCFIDSAYSKHNTYYCNIPVISFDDYVKKIMEKDDYIFIACDDYYSISKKLDFYNLRYEFWMDKNVYGDIERLFVDTYKERTLSMEVGVYHDSFRKQDEEQIDMYTDALYKANPLFNHIEIETLNRCNGNCSFCPVNRQDDSRPFAKMEKGLFVKIIQELKCLNYSGCICLFSNNEPFLDDRMIVFHDYAREMLPKAKFHLFTNGTLLQMDVFKDVIGFLDELIINNYSEKQNIMRNIEQIIEFCKKDPELVKKVTVVMRHPREILETRAGAAPNTVLRKTNPYCRIKCTHPFRQIIIRPDGKVSLCCNDALGKTNMGDVTKQSLKDIWYGETFMNIRKLLYEGGRENVGFCKNCDSLRLV